MTKKFAFELKINKQENGCWIWTGAKDFDGYGKFTIESKNRHNKVISAHRASLHFYINFDFNSDLQVNHKCNIRACVNPDHLYIGTQKDNMRDYSNSITHCPKGHNKKGKIKCKMCYLEYKERKRNDRKSIQL